MWAYDYLGERIRITGKTSAYLRNEKTLAFHHCPNCACVTHWQGVHPDEDGRIRTAVNLRLSEPETVADIVLEHFDGLDSFSDLGQDGRTVRDVWFWGSSKKSNPKVNSE